MIKLDSRPSLPSIKVPTLVAVGGLDILMPPGDAEDMHRQIAGSTHLVCVSSAATADGNAGTDIAAAATLAP